MITFTFCAVVCGFTFVAMLWAKFACSAYVCSPRIKVAILALCLAPFVVSQVCGISALQANVSADAEAAVLCTERASVTNTTCKRKLPVAIWAGFLARPIRVEVVVVFALRADLGVITGVTVFAALLADDANFSDAIRVVTRRTCIFASRKWSQVCRVFALTAVRARITFIASGWAPLAGSSKTGALVAALLLEVAIRALALAR
mmetsp:Transcript_68817/g.121609  ORF Transcript_68817/g.121609 Transcript_68817/m.121609 type:complete len:204 (-) Transcript_68817:1859-2470(-)